MNLAPFNHRLSRRAPSHPHLRRMAGRACLALAVGLAMIPAVSARAAEPPSTRSAASRAAVANAAELEIHAYETQLPADYRAAASAMENALNGDAEDLPLQRKLGFLYLEKLNDPARSIPHLRIACHAAPKEPGWREMLAKALDATHEYAEEVEVRRQITTENPSDPWARLALAHAEEKAGLVADSRDDYRQAWTLAPKEPWLEICYARSLLAAGELDRADALAQATLSQHPDAPQVRLLVADIARARGNLSDAATLYRQALKSDPQDALATDGLYAIWAAREPAASLSAFYFLGNDHFYQSGAFAALTVPFADHLAATAKVNAFMYSNKTSNFGQVARIEQAADVDWTPYPALSLDVGAQTFECRDTTLAGVDATVTLKPNGPLYVYGLARTADPVSDSITTVARVYSQNVLGVGAGVQFTSYLGLSFAGSHGFYSDGNDRDDARADLTCVLPFLPEFQTGITAAIEAFRERSPDYPSSAKKETIGPFFDYRPQLFTGVSLHARLELPYYNEARRLSETVNIGPSLHLADGLDVSAEYIYVHAPDSYENYSGQGARFSLTYKF